MQIDNKLLEKYNVPVPRYTSYPPANHFHDFNDAAKAVHLIIESNRRQPNLVAFYIHIPFCKKICYYCGCNACTLKSMQTVAEYIQMVKEELRQVMDHIDKNRKVSQIHYGGGTPNAIDVKYLAEINQLIFNEFELIEQAEVAIECNPAYLDYDYLDGLLAAKFNRFSLGIQDFNVQVLKNVNREPSAIPVSDIVNYLKSKDSSITINLDFIYGLPGQTITGFVETMEEAIKIRPDRLVTFSYAHVPWLKKHQQILEKKGLPSSEDKMDMFLSAYAVLKDAGYIPVGLDHFVLPTDELNLALEKHQLHRNFQGYCTRRTTGQVYAVGVSAISQLENGYIQNIKDLKPYVQQVKAGKLPVEKGLELTNHHVLVRDAINELMCNKHLDISALIQRQGYSMAEFYAITGFSTDKLDEFINDKLLTFTNQVILVTELGALFIRNIAATFDPEYKIQQGKYSKTV